MSRIGRMPITVPAGVEVTIAENNVVTVKGPKGTLTQALRPEMILEQDGSVIHVKRPSDDKLHCALHGMTRALQEGTGDQRRRLPRRQGREEPGHEPGLFPPGHRSRDRRHHH